MWPRDRYATNKRDEPTPPHSTTSSRLTEPGYHFSHEALRRFLRRGRPAAKCTWGHLSRGGRLAVTPEVPPVTESHCATRDLPLSGHRRRSVFLRWRNCGTVTSPGSQITNRLRS